MLQLNNKFLVMMYPSTIKAEKAREIRTITWHWKN
jgi:hypothetical protein